MVFYDTFRRTHHMVTVDGMGPYEERRQHLPLQTDFMPFT